MGKISLEVPHTLSKEEARRRIEQLAQDWSAKYGITSQWNQDTVRLWGKIMGLPVEAEVQIAEGAVHTEATDPGFLFREKAKKYVLQKLTWYLAPALPPRDA
jgi:putative polyhydroxyalkanoate system protein